eukprot:116674-Alexandrium_andersonii.AAC.1
MRPCSSSIARAMFARFGAGGARGCAGSCSGPATRRITCGSGAPAFAGPWRHARGTAVRFWSAPRNRLSAS